MSAAWDRLAGVVAGNRPLRVGREIVRLVFRYRLTNLAGEAGFFTLLSLPPLILGLAAVAAWMARGLGLGGEFDLERDIADLVSPFLTEDVVDSVVLPTFRDALKGPQYGLLSIGFLISLWSGSRAMNTYVETISIVYGQHGRRNFLLQRALSFGLYLLALLVGAVTLPLVAVGPDVLRGWLPSEIDFLVLLYWPVVSLLSVGMLAGLYHVATPVRVSWWRDLPGALLGLAIWFLASYVMRIVLSYSIGGTSIYGPLATPIIVLLWLYLVAIAVLVGAAANAAIARVYGSVAGVGGTGVAGDDAGDGGGHPITRPVAGESGGGEPARPE